MKILIFSDSHGRSANMLKAIEYHPDAEILFHLGDGTDDLKDVSEKYPSLPVKYVKGNKEDCLFTNRNDNPFLVERVGNKIIYLCHGHRHNVSYTEQSLIYSAICHNADIVLYGHTHVKENKYLPDVSQDENGEKKGLYVFNPGSISRPRDGLSPSYGIIEIRSDGVLLSHGLIK